MNEIEKMRNTWKSTPGPWNNEPDEKSWTDPATGLDCYMQRNHFGCWCGYVRIPETHPLFGMDYCDEVPERLRNSYKSVMEGPIGQRGIMAVFCAAGSDSTRAGTLFDVHGSITFSGERNGAGFWYGFDCAHYGDLAPGMPLDSVMRDSSTTYRDEAYVTAQCESLARQVNALIVPEPV